MWDLEQGQSKLTLKVGEVIQSMSWSANGSLLVTTSRDKKLRIWDPRQEKPVQEANGHGGAKNSRAVWMGEHDRIATTGFSRMSDRQLALWDIKACREPIGGFQMLDSISGVCVPFWDDGTQCLYLAGKGDGNIRYYEYQNDKFEYLSEYKSSDPQRGIAFLPKRGVNIHENEVMRAYKTVNDSYVEPISFIVPRRAESFQEDIYPPTVGLKPAMSSKEWLEGSEALPPKVSMESLYEGKGLEEVPADQIKPAPKAAEPVKQPETTPVAAAKKEEPEVVQPPQSAVAVAPVSMKEQGASMSAMADKFADKEPAEEEDDSSFEEVPKPVDRTPATKPVPADVKEEDVGSATPALPKITEEPKRHEEIPSTPPVAKTEEVQDLAASVISLPESTTGSNEALEREIKNMKTIMAQQNRQLATLARTVSDLVEQVKALKS